MPGKPAAPPAAAPAFIDSAVFCCIFCSISSMLASSPVFAAAAAADAAASAEPLPVLLFPGLFDFGLLALLGCRGGRCAEDRSARGPQRVSPSRCAAPPRGSTTKWT